VKTTAAACAKLSTTQNAEDALVVTDLAIDRKNTIWKEDTPIVLLRREVDLHQQFTPPSSKKKNPAVRPLTTVIGRPPAFWTSGTGATRPHRACGRAVPVRSMPVFVFANSAPSTWR